MAISRSTQLSTDFGDFKVNYHTFESGYCMSLIKGDVAVPNTLVRFHSSCIFSESFHSIDCDCNLQLSKSMELISKEGRGVIVYTYEEGRGVGLENKIMAMEVERTENVDTVIAFEKLNFDIDGRRYDIAIQALRDLNVDRNIRLISNNPRKRTSLVQGGFNVIENVKLEYELNDIQRKYLEVKKNKLGHNL